MKNISSPAEARWHTSLSYLIGQSGVIEQITTDNNCSYGCVALSDQKIIVRLASDNFEYGQKVFLLLGKAGTTNDKRHLYQLVAHPFELC